MRSVTLGVVTVVLALGLGACSGDAPAAPEPSQSFGVAPTGDAVVIEPLESIDGATTETVNGVAIEVPEGFEAEVATLSSGGEQLVVKDPAEPRAAVIVTVSEQDAVSDESVDVAAQTSQTQLAASGAWSDLTLAPATWQGFPHGAATTGTLTLPDGAERDAILVTVRDEDGTRVVSVSAEAPAGELDASLAYEVLRTMRIDG